MDGVAPGESSADGVGDTVTMTPPHVRDGQSVHQPSVSTAQQPSYAAEPAYGLEPLTHRLTPGHTYSSLPRYTGTKPGSQPC